MNVSLEPVDGIVQFVKGRVIKLYPAGYFFP